MNAPKDFEAAPDALKDRVILITGAGDGLGRAAAVACAKHGATVILLGRTVKKLEATDDAIRAAGGAAAIYPMNLAGASWKDFLDLAATLEREFGKLHGLLHCAAHFKQFAPLSEVDPKEWMESLQVNVTAPFALTRACLPLMQKTGAASVVFVTDRAREPARPFQGAYGVSKRALEALMQTWAAELPKDGVRVNSFDPGPLRTPLRARGFPGAPQENAPSAESAVPALLWLLSDASRGVSGGQL